MWFQQVVEGSTHAIKDERLVRSTALPREIWVLRLVLAKFCEYAFALPVLAIFAMAYRAPVGWEILLTVPAVSNLIREGKTFQIPSVMQTNRRVGMVTLNDALMELVESKQVEPKEAYMKAVEKAGFAAALKAKRYDVSFLGEG